LYRDKRAGWGRRNREEKKIFTASLFSSGNPSSDYELALLSGKKKGTGGMRDPGMMKSRGRECWDKSYHIWVCRDEGKSGLGGRHVEGPIKGWDRAIFPSRGQK